MKTEIAAVLSHIGGNWRPTCSVYNPINNGVAFLRASSRPRPSRKSVAKLFLICPDDDTRYNDWIVPLRVREPEWVFAVYHNSLDHKLPAPPLNVASFIGVHTSVSLGEKGIRVVENKAGERILLNHYGGVKIGRDVYIGPLSVVHSGTFDPTVIGDDVTIGSLVNVGHNCRIGDKVIIASSAVLAGSVTIGDRCFIGAGAVIVNGVNIPDGCFIGAGSTVSKSPKTTGKYIGNKRIGDWNECW